MATARDIRLQRQLEELIPGLFRPRPRDGRTRTVNQPPSRARESSIADAQFATGLWCEPFDAIVDRTVTVARAKADDTLSLHQKSRTILRQLESACATLERDGQLSTQVEDELNKLAGVALNSMEEFSNEHATTLATFLAPPPQVRGLQDALHNTRASVQVSNEELYAQVREMNKFVGKLYGPPAPLRWLQRLKG